MQKMVTTFAFLLLTARASAETVRYEAYKLLPNGGKELIAQGAREYSPTKDIELVSPCGCAKPSEPNRRLALFGAYGLEVGPATDDPADGFGLMISDGATRSFSWNWFSPPRRVPSLITLLTGIESEPTDIFHRLSQNARVRVVTRGANGVTELESVEFLDDVALGFVDDMTRVPVGTDSHEFVIRKGSVLRLLARSSP